MKDGKFEEGDIVEYNNSLFYYGGNFGKVKCGDGPWHEQGIIIRLRKNSLLPDKRSMRKHGYAAFSKRVNVSDLKLHKDKNES